MSAQEIKRELAAKADLIRLAKEVLEEWEVNKHLRDINNDLVFLIKPTSVNLAKHILQNYEE